MRWIAPPLWQDGECWIIGGGPSMPRQFHVPEQVVHDVMVGASKPAAYSPYLSALHNRHVIGVNNAYQIGTWIDILFFGDRSWYLVHRELLAKFPGLKVTCCAGFDVHPPVQKDGIKYLSKDNTCKHGISSDPKMVSWNNNSGAAAISLAVHLGVKRIILLGFDMSLDSNSVSHWHGSHRKVRELPKKTVITPPFARHLRGFPLIAKDAKRMGVEIINASPDSAIRDFKRCTVDEILGNTQDVAEQNGCDIGRGTILAGDIATVQI